MITESVEVDVESTDVSLFSLMIGDRRKKCHAVNFVWG